MYDPIEKYDSNVLMHHGVKGQKWGVRRFQNPDGTLTEAGHKRYARLEKSKSKYEKRLSTKDTRMAKARSLNVKATEYKRNRDMHNAKANKLIFATPVSRAYHDIRANRNNYKYAKNAKAANRIVNKILKEEKKLKSIDAKLTALGSSSVSKVLGD